MQQNESDANIWKETKINIGKTVHVFTLHYHYAFKWIIHISKNGPYSKTKRLTVDFKVVQEFSDAKEKVQYASRITLPSNAKYLQQGVNYEIFFSKKIILTNYVIEVKSNDYWRCWFIFVLPTIYSIYFAPI